MNEPVAYLGPRGTFTHEATRALFPEDHTLHTPCDSIPDVLTAVDRGEFPYGVVPVENAIEGSVTLTLDWLVHHVDVPITGELIYPIAQHLMVHSSRAGEPLSKITRVLSHPQAVAQCRGFLRENLPKAVVTYVDSTADAARQVRDHASETWAAIGPFMAHQLYGLQLAAQQIQDYENNFTRFIVVGKEWAHPLVLPESRKSSLLVALPSDYPGALYKVLQSFVEEGINLSRIESRPTKKKLGTYHFFIDAEAELSQSGMERALTSMESWGCQVRRLGSYPCHSYQTLNKARVDNTSWEAYNHR
ncbi:prephenate dehydratase [Salinithrix halophila]|uniref:Prephenate dehydratase n=1 Tax=Salinithrix halophila TaxID=1485204 RepID=A0ABV8JNL3_9BACL